MTLFHLVRHGEHARQGSIIAGRTTGIGLSARGRAEVDGIAEHLSSQMIEAIYASPLDRTRETAAIIARRFNLPVCVREDLIELDFGEWTGLTYDQVRNDKRWVPWQACRSIAAIPGGESWRAVQDRVVHALFDLRRQHPEQTVVMVSHGDVIRAAMLFALGMPLDFYNRIEVGTGSISTIRIDQHGVRILAMNGRPKGTEP